MVYEQTNESMEAIVRALSPQNEDRIITICSCAQPFALVEHIDNGSVLAVDCNRAQISFAKKVLRVLASGDERAVSSLHLTPKNPGYFINQGKLERIRRNAKNLRFRLQDVSDKPSIQGTFTKGYFSNAPVHLLQYHALFEREALVYVTYATAYLPDDVLIFKKQWETRWKCRMDDWYAIDQERTRTACDMEQKRMFLHRDGTNAGAFEWTPCIFRRK